MTPMTPEESEAHRKKMEAAVDRATNRLVECRLAHWFVDDTNTGKGTFSFTDTGGFLSQTVKRYFDVPDVGSKPIPVEDIMAFVQLILHTKPVKNPRKNI